MRLLCSISILFSLITNTTTSKLAFAETSTKIIIPLNVGVILEEQDWIGQMGYKCMQMALSDWYATHFHYKTRLFLHTHEYNHSDVLSPASAALSLINNVEAKAIIGPLTSSETQFVISLGTKAQVPIISYTATSPFLSSLASPYFIRATQNDLSQVQAIMALNQAFGWREVVPIYGNDEYGRGIMPELVRLLGTSTQLPYQSVISPLATDDQLLEELYKLQTMQTRVFIVHLWPNIGVRMFLKAKEAGMMSEGYVWILTSGMVDILESYDRSVLESMQGVLGVKTYVPRTPQLENFTSKWSKTFKHDYRVNVYGLWAYDAALALAMAAEEFGSSLDYFGVLDTNRTNNNLAGLGDILVSDHGPKLLQAILKTSFRGLEGEFSLSKDGELIKPSVYQIINVVGNGWKEVGFWTTENGLVKDMKEAFSGSHGYSTSKSNLRAIIWPGDSLSVPKGWVIPTSDKRLRIGVPMKYGFKEFVNVQTNSETNTTQVTGYCIDVFDTVMKMLPYYVPYEFIPHVEMQEVASSSYNDLSYQVYLGKYDAVVGDVTIVANRSLYVDYTLPYTESGVTMVVPVRKEQRKKAWLFMKPLTWDLWVITFFFFVFIAFVIWVLEHRVNEDFRGPALYQAGTALYFAFSTMVFAHTEGIYNNLARSVMVFWFFFVLILTQSYTASLTSMLTVTQLKPSIQDVNEVIRKGESVAYQQGSFVEGLLRQIGFKEKHLKPYKDCEELDELLSKGSKNGGVAAVFDEVPYMRLFLEKYCHNKYTMVQPTYKTGGFGFVFPKGSPLVPDVSREILSATEGGKIVAIEKEWFTAQNSCKSSSSYISYDDFSLGLESFWGLFLITGLAAIIALAIFLVEFLYKHQHIWMRQDTSVWSKIVEVANTFNEIDKSFYKFKKKQEELEKWSCCDKQHSCDDAAESAPNTNCPPSPFSDM